MEILITGGSGFLGSHLVRSLLAESHEVTCITRATSDLSRLSDLLALPNFKIACVDSGKRRDDFDEILNRTNFDAIVHVATEYGRGSNLDVDRVLQSNILMPVTLLNAAIDHGVKLFVNTDSYFNKPDLDYLALPDYSLSKKAFLEWLRVSSSRINVVNMRLEHVYGPNDSPSKFIPFIVDQLCRVKPETISLTSGHQKRDFIYVADVVKAYQVLLAEFDFTSVSPSFTEYEIGTGESTPISEVSRLVKTISKSSTNLGYGTIPSRENEIHDSFASNLFKDNFPWEPRTALRAGLEILVSEALDAG